jgi:hypothetical protein
LRRDSWAGAYKAAIDEDSRRRNPSVCRPDGEFEPEAPVPDGVIHSPGGADRGIVIRGGAETFLASFHFVSSERRPTRIP